MIYKTVVRKSSVSADTPSPKKVPGTFRSLLSLIRLKKIKEYERIDL